MDKLKAVIVLQSEQVEHFSTFIRRKAFYRNGLQAMKASEGKGNLAYIIPTTSVYKELGRNNSDALVARGIKVVINETGEDFYCDITNTYIKWDYKYEFDKIERIPYNYLAIAVGDIYKNPKMKGGNNFYLNNPNRLMVDGGKDVIRRAAKRKK